MKRLAVAVLGTALLAACAPRTTGESRDHPLILARLNELVAFRPGQTLYLAQTVTASALGIPDSVLSGVNSETAFNGRLSVMPSGNPYGWALSLDHVTLLRGAPLGGAQQGVGLVRLYLKVSAPQYFGKDFRTLAYQVGYAGRLTALSVNVLPQR